MVLYHNGLVKGIMPIKVDVRQLYNQLAPSYNQLTLIEDYLFGVNRLCRRFFIRFLAKSLKSQQALVKIYRIFG